MPEYIGVPPVVHGHNADINGDCGCFLCSICGIYIEFKAYSATEELDFNIKFCPNCGAKIDGKDGEHNAQT